MCCSSRTPKQRLARLLWHHFRLQDISELGTTGRAESTGSHKPFRTVDMEGLSLKPAASIAGKSKHLPLWRARSILHISLLCEVWKNGDWSAQIPLFATLVGEWGCMHAFQFSIHFLNSQDETKVIPYSKLKRWEKGQKHSIVINKTKSACTCTGYDTINNIGKNLART